MVSKHTFSLPKITKKTNLNTQAEYLTIVAVFLFQNGRQNIRVLLSQFLIDFEKFWCLNIHFRDQRLHKRQFKIGLR